MNTSKIVHEWNGHLGIFSRPQVIENSQVMGPFHPINRQKTIDKGKLIDKLIIVYNRFLILSIVSVRRPDPTEPPDKIPALQAESAEKTVPTEIFQSAPTQTTLQTSLQNEISYEFTPLRDQSQEIIFHEFLCSIVSVDNGLLQRTQGQ